MTKSMVSPQLVCAWAVKYHLLTHLLPAQRLYARAERRWYREDESKGKMQHHLGQHSQHQSGWWILTGAAHAGRGGWHPSVPIPKGWNRKGGQLLGIRDWWRWKLTGESVTEFLCVGCYGFFLNATKKCRQTGDFVSSIQAFLSSHIPLVLHFSIQARQLFMKQISTPAPSICSTHPCLGRVLSSCCFSSSSSSAHSYIHSQPLTSPLLARFSSSACLAPTETATHTLPVPQRCRETLGNSLK